MFVVRIGELSAQKDEGVKKSLYLPPENDGDTSRSGAESAPERRFGERTARKPRQDGMPRRRNETTDDRTVLHSVFLARGQRPEPRHGGYVSGNIIGMILLFASLCLRWVPADRVRPAARFLLGSMALFFVPYGVGLMVSYRVILENLWAILVSGVISTVLVIFVAGKTFQSLNRRARMRHIRHMRHAE